MDDTVLDKRDASIQRHFPTLMMPKHGGLPPLEMHMTRLVMAKEGIYIQTNRPWGSLTRKIFTLPKYLPYGHLDEDDQFLPVLENKIMPIVREEMLPEAAKYAEKGKEWQGFVVYENGSFKYHPAQFKATAVRVRYDVPGNIVADVHSHHKMKPFWSSTDNADDAGGVKIAMVLGRYDPAKTPLFDMKLRYCIEGFFFNYEEDPIPEELIEHLLSEIKITKGLVLP